MSTVFDATVLARLESRIAALRADSARRWGTLTAAAMLCHLADGFERVLRRPDETREPSRPLRKWVALRSDLPWPRDAPTRQPIDLQRDAARICDFGANRERALRGLRAVAAARAESFPPAHSHFGAMSAADWHRWAYRHSDHHLRQFGV